MIANTARKLHYILLICFVVSLPFNLPGAKLSNLIMILLGINWLFFGDFSLKNRTAQLMVCFFLLHLIGLLYTTNLKQGFFEIDKKVSFVVFPLVVGGLILTAKQFKTILLAFASSTITATMICLAYAIIKLVIDGNTDYFFYHALSHTVGMHAIYLAIYVCFSIFIISWFYWEKVYSGTFTQKAVFSLVVLYLIVILFLLSARTTITAFTLIMIAAVMRYGYMKKMLLPALSVVALMLVVFAGLIFFNKNNLERFKEAINYNSEYTIEKQYGGRSTRELIWNCAGSVAKEAAPFGVGTGDAQDALQLCYQEREYGPLLYIPDLKYNAHNQYLQTSIDLGVPGLIIFILCLLLPAREALRKNDYLLLTLVALFSISALTESLLELNRGILFFAFFWAVWTTRHRQSDQKGTQ